MTIQIKATEQYLPVMLFILLYKVVLSFGMFESVDEILLKCDHSNAIGQNFQKCFLFSKCFSNLNGFC